MACHSFLIGMVKWQVTVPSGQAASFYVLGEDLENRPAVQWSLDPPFRVRSSIPREWRLRSDGSSRGLTWAALQRLDGEYSFCTSNEFFLVLNHS